jgi:hypothetical protein
MSFDDIRAGTVLSYPYLWSWQADGGETEGRKHRPTAVALRIRRVDADLLVLLPITTKQPAAGRRAVEVPTLEKRSAGLDTTLRHWIILDELNQDVVGNSYYLEPDARKGQLNPRFFGPIVQQVIDQWREIRRIPRR